VAIRKDEAVVRQLRTLFQLGTIRELTDGQLLEIYATERGEAAELAFAALVERHGPMVLRVCRGVLQNSDDSEDAFQATFLVLVKKARGLWVRESLGPWLHQVAYRTASCARSSAARHRRIESQTARSKQEAFTTVEDDLGSALHEEINRLPDRFRAPVVLCDFEGRSHEQAARSLGWPIGTVKSRHSRGRERLRDRLTRRGLAPGAGLAVIALASEEIQAAISPALVDSTTRTAFAIVTFHTLRKSSAATLAQGVIRSMSAIRYLRAASVLVVVSTAVSTAGWLAGRSIAPVSAQAEERAQVPRGAELTTYSVKPGPLLVSVIGPGNLEPSRSEDVYCQVEGSTKILTILPEGSAVKKGDAVCQLDSARLRDQLTNQQIAENRAEASFALARSGRETSELAVREFVEGKLPRERERLRAEADLARRAIVRAEASLKRARDARERLNAISAARPGTVSPADLAAELDIEDRRDAADQAIEREKKTLESATANLKLLETFTAPRTTRELQIDVEQKRSDELAKKQVWELAQSKTKKLDKMIQYCLLRAPSDGLFVYGNDPNSRLAIRAVIEEGAAVRERQLVFRVIDLKRPLRVNAKIHEAWIDQLLPGMQARVRIDAFPNSQFHGKVTEVYPLPDAVTRVGDDRKVYTTHVLLGDGDPALRPGMNAHVEVIIKDLESVLSVPVSAVLSFGEQYHVALKKPDGGIVWRVVTVGAANDKFVEIKDGIQSGDEVVANPLVLMTEDEKREKLAMPAPRARKKSGRPAGP
jgi:RND family efflux transporter MFP subunit